MIEQLEQILAGGLQALASVQNQDDLDAWRVRHLGRSSAVMQVFATLGSLLPAERPLVGRRANETKTALEAAWERCAATLAQESLRRSLNEERPDTSLPGRTFARGRLHPTTLVMRRVLQIYNDMGFQTLRTPEVETDELNFQLLNLPPHHPARELQDTFYIDRPDDPERTTRLLRTQTSAGQIHAMRLYSSTQPDHPPPVRVVLPGMVYRYEQVSPRHETQFHQVEGLAVARGITFSDLKGAVVDMAHRLFGGQVRLRFRASHYPFTEPSADLDVECLLCGGKGCSVCSFTGWIECIGCGMVHPVVLVNGGYDPQLYSGFAFGIGVGRLTLLYYNIPDIRYFWMNDLRFLAQF
jgi:phenylalanyl-tRNA synthetase alpha chain